MQQELKNIFVTKEVARLAKEKGFDEICAGYFEPNESDVSPNCGYSLKFILNPCDNQDKYIEAPTHFQLIQWLLKNHEIDVWHSFNEWDAMPKYSESKSFTSINDALIFALNQINQQQNGK